jgi:predicted  nucleic acid-binding Zn-ribbon protein
MEEIQELRNTVNEMEQKKKQDEESHARAMQQAQNNANEHYEQASKAEKARSEIESEAQNLRAQIEEQNLRVRCNRSRNYFKSCYALFVVLESELVASCPVPRRRTVGARLRAS